MIDRDPHALADVVAFTATWPAPLDELAAPAWLDALCEGQPPADLPPLADADAAKRAVRDMLRVGGFKPAGRNKPCSEYIRAVSARGAFPRINAAVDLCNAAVLHGGLPVSCVDLDRLRAPLRVAIAPAGARYVFNLGGQELDLGGLWCLHDADGPCSNAVKDAQRAKTGPQTRTTLSIVWGTASLPGRATALAHWYAAQSGRLGAAVTELTSR
jgi:DNA/RNA-binding domain of Phe-tRNA-synthetase-like protein